MFVLVSAALASDPTAVLRWRGDVGSLDVHAPAGWHIAPEAPASLALVSTDGRTTVTTTTLGDPSSRAVPIPQTAFRATVTVSVCVDGGTECRAATLEGTGGPAPRGRIDLAPAQRDVAATGHGTVVRLLDFTAVWCPPCNLLAAEVLHDPAGAGVLAGLEVEAVDVDQPGSWALKDRYAVGGYPTLIAVDAAGGEVARLVGYPGRAATVAWIEGLATTVPLDRLAAGDPTIQGAAASTAARRLAQAEKPDAARAYFDRAADDVDLHVARLLVDGDRADADWLFTHAPPGDWLFPALDAAPDRWPAVAAMLPSLDPVLAADLFDVVGAQVGGDAGRTLTAAALVVVLQAMHGDPVHDKAHVTYAADLYARLGRLDDALALLDRYLTWFPSEFTWDNTACRLLLDANRLPEAEARGRAALQKGWGDQRLRAVQPLARAVARQGRTTEAVALLDAALAEATRPDPALQVRTHRYLKQVEDLRAELAAVR